MIATVYSASVWGINATTITVELDLGTGFPVFTLVGLPDTAVKEARERVKSAIRNSGLPFPANHRIIFNLAPADIKKTGPFFDLPIAVALIKAHLPLATDTDTALFIGELALDGSLRPLWGILPIALHAKEYGFKTIYLPKANAQEAACVDGISVRGAHSLTELLAHLTGQKIIPEEKPTATQPHIIDYEFDLQNVQGQHFAKRALEIAAVGGHNLLFTGPPGAGKTLLARTLPSILPPMSKSEMLEVTKIYSVAGLIPSGFGLLTTRPFRTPHHSASAVSIIGGGSVPRPGEVSLAHRGVLFLDETPEFPRAVLEHLRQPLEDGHVTVTRIKETVRFPARFIMIMSQNPCPCGFWGDQHHPCTCTTNQVQNYQNRISGPLLDRTDMVVTVGAVSLEELTGDSKNEASAVVRARVATARNFHWQRFPETDPRGPTCNAELKPQHLKVPGMVDASALALLKNASSHLQLSARSFYRTLKVARTIADLAGKKTMDETHVAEALQFRGKET